MPRTRSLETHADSQVAFAPWLAGWLNATQRRVNRIEEIEHNQQAILIEVQLTIVGRITLASLVVQTG